MGRVERKVWIVGEVCLALKFREIRQEKIPVAAVVKDRRQSAS